MLQKFLSKINPTKDKFISELLRENFRTDILSSLLESGIDINSCDDNNDTFLNIAIQNNKISATRWLLENNCSISIRNKQHLSVLQLAIQQSNVKIVRLLLERADIDCEETDKNGRTLLQDAIIAGKLDILNELLKKSPNINALDNKHRNLLFDAVDYGEDKIIKKVLSIDELNVNNKDISGETILHKKLVLENDNLAKILLKHKANPTITDDTGKSFLFHTALRGEDGMDLMDFAIKQGCDLNSKVRDNNSILMELMFNLIKLPSEEKNKTDGLMAMAKKLLDHGININAINSFGETILFDAVRKNEKEAVTFLLENGMDVNHTNKEQETALSISIINGIDSIDVILLLLKYKATMMIKIQNLKTIIEILNDVVLHISNNRLLSHHSLLSQINLSKGNYIIVLKTILENTKNIDLNYIDSTGAPIYFKSLLSGNIELFKLYIKYGIDSNKPNENNMTIFHEYVISSFKNNVKIDTFRNVLLLLSSIKVNVNKQLSNGKTIISHILLRSCNEELFKTLVSVIRFNYKIQDKIGKTLIHSCVVGGNIKVLKIIDEIDNEVINIPDDIGMLPITYAALMGKTQMLLEMINLNSHITSNKKITAQAKETFSKLLPNLDKLSIGIENSDDLRKIDIVVNQIKKDFDV
ncbi:MAG: ankyrin repeat domain-containing protein [Arcobacteraceae bacterium]|nr:ankyrin repeat domain-containing protein [Arcobacteraceae bacterium]